MRKVFILMCFVIVLQNTCYASSQVELSKEENIILALVWPRVTDVINAYYSEYISGKVTITPYPYYASIVALTDDKSDSDECGRYTVIVEVTPYIGAHNPVGRDRITISVDAAYGTQVCKFQHLESYEILHPYQKERIIKPLP